MKLIDLNPRWIGTEDGRAGVGIRFTDPRVGCGVRILFSNPLDGGEPLPNDERVPANNRGERWLREGDDFATLTIRPSIDGSPEASHLTVTAGEIHFS